MSLAPLGDVFALVAVLVAKSNNFLLTCISEYSQRGAGRGRGWKEDRREPRRAKDVSNFSWHLGILNFEGLCSIEVI